MLRFSNGAYTLNLVTDHSILPGPIVRYSPDGLIVNDPTLIPVIYHMKADKTDFNAANFGSVTTFTLKSHKDHIASKKRINHAVRLEMTMSQQAADRCAHVVLNEEHANV